MMNNRLRLATQKRSLSVFITNFSIAFSHIELTLKLRLLFEFGRLIQTDSPDDLELRSRFQLHMFRDYRTRLIG
jgi:hypothetical protein